MGNWGFYCGIVFILYIKFGYFNKYLNKNNIIKLRLKAFLGSGLDFN